MIRFTIRILVYALVLAIAITLAPGITIQSLVPGTVEISATYMLFGILFGLINAFIRPLVLLFTAKMVLRTMGLFAVIINTALLALMGWIAGDVFVIESPQLLWLIWGGLVLTIVALVLEALFGLEMPAFRSQIETQFYWRWVKWLSTGRRNKVAENLRAGQILAIINRYTQDIAVEMSPLARFRHFVQRLLFQDVDLMYDLTLQEKVRYMIQELGPTFVKFGQIISSRATDLPPEWNEELGKLQSNVPPFSYEKAEQILTEELKDTPENLYAEFEEEPFAAASIGQVHRATLHDGTKVVVKIQRPNIDVAVKADLNVINDLAGSVQRKREWAQTIDLYGLVKEFGDSILTELDYRNEASNMGLLARNMVQFEVVHVPKVYASLTTSKVLTMEFLPGVKINDVQSIEAAGIDRYQLAKDFVQVMVKQALFDGFFHADPHPGNVLVDLETSQIGFLDMGLMGEMNRMQRMALGDVLVSMVDRDGYSLGKAALRLSKPIPGTTTDEAAFLEAMEMFGERFLGVEGPMEVAFDALQGMLRRFGRRLDSNFVLAFKTLMQADQIIRTLYPDISFSDVAVESSKKLLREQITTENLAEMVTKQVSRSSREIVYRLPSLVDATTKWLDQYEKGRMSVHIDTSDLTPQVEQLDEALGKSLDRLIIGLVLAGWLVGAAIASTADIDIRGFPLSDLAFYMFLAGTVLGAIVAVQAIVRLNKKEDLY
ncbi:MAG: phage holin family protein [Anaerolineaceae bacterium]|nr:MAG: phage holin family protein [Anaerolineaceae bacterium]